MGTVEDKVATLEAIQGRIVDTVAGFTVEATRTEAEADAAIDEVNAALERLKAEREAANAERRAELDRQIAEREVERQAALERQNAATMKSQSGAGYARGAVKQAAIRDWKYAGEQGGIDA